MINQEKVAKLIKNIQPDINLNRSFRWIKALGLDKWGGPDEDLNNIPTNKSLAAYAIQQAVLSSIGNFNFWEKDGKIAWPGLSSNDWMKVIRFEKPIEEMNLVEKRKELWDKAVHFMSDSELTNDIHDNIWWEALAIVFGGDPLAKRETLLWITLSDLGFTQMHLPNAGCIDYNIILALRYLEIITGYEGNIFDKTEETKLRFECLHVVEQILKERQDLNVSDLDSFLYKMGRYIRYEFPREIWDPYFCYRIGCFYY